MRRIVILVPALVCAVALLTEAVAQPPRGKGGKEKSKDGSSLVERMMAFDKNKDGKLTKEEVTDERLHRLFDLADTNKDGEVTKEELEALAKKLEAEGDEGGPKMKKGKGDEFGGKGKGKGGFEGPGGRMMMMGPPRPGQVLPEFILEQLKLTPEQKKQLDALQKDVDGKLAKILTDEQKEKMKNMPRFGPPGGPGGKGPPDKGGPGGKGGPPPDKDRR